MTKQTFISNANAYGVTATYSGSTNTMFVGGEDTKVKSFIRVCNLKGKKAYNFAFAQK
jgi:hypothetical protein